MTARLMLVRHGETPSNVRHALDSRPPGPSLTDIGVRQAAALAERLAGETVLAVYASVATRAKETAAPVALRHGVPVEVVEGLHEVQAGDLEGLSDDDSLRRFGAVYTKWTEGELTAAMPGGERGTEIRERFLAALAGVWARHADGPDGLVVVVSHGGAIRLVAEWLADNVGPLLANAKLLPNTGHVLLEPRGNAVAGSLGCWHCVEWTGVDVSRVAD